MILELYIILQFLKYSIRRTEKKLTEKKLKEHSLCYFKRNYNYRRKY